jgi:hypothetical protein
MKVIGRWMPLGLAACLMATGCKKEETTPPPAPAEPTAPAAKPIDAGAELPVDAGTEQPVDAGAEQPVDAGATPSGSQALQPEDPKSREWTAGRVNVQRASLKPVTLREVREGLNEGFDRVVFQFDGEQVPGYQLEYIDKPVIKCGSGDPTELAGQGWLQVRLQPAQAHADGKATVTERERKPKLSVIEELELTCDFEGEATWVLGVKKPNKYRVLELKEPTRLVVDVQH